jgi:HSP20 family molecular chaperone IbpA
MKTPGEKAKRNLAIAITLAFCFAGGFMSRDYFDKQNSARASEAASVPVEKISESQLSNKVNSLIAPHLWDIYIDPFFTPVQWPIKPMPLVPLMTFPTETPKVQTIDGDKELRVIAQVPGMNENDVKVQAGEQSVIIKAHKKQEEKNNGRFETFDEAFEQSVHLPCKVNADKIQASVKDGILTVTLPKS